MGKISATKRVSRYVILTTDVTAITNGTNLQRATIPLSKFAGIKAQTTSLDQNIVFGNYIEKPTLDIVGETYTFVTDATNLYIQVPLGTWIDLTSAQNALLNTVVYYELAEPITIPFEDFSQNDISVIGTLASNTSYTNFYQISSDITPDINISYPIDVGASLSSLKDGVGALTSLPFVLDNPTVTTITTGFASGWSGTIIFRKNHNNLMQIIVDVTKSTDMVAGDDTIYTAAVGLRPANNAVNSLAILTSSGLSLANVGAYGGIDVNGTIFVHKQGTLTSGRRLAFSMMYYTA